VGTVLRTEPRRCGRNVKTVRTEGSLHRAMAYWAL